VELGAHHVVVVAGEHADAGAALPVPDADGLVVRRAQDPRVLVVEHRRPDVVQVPQQRENAPLLLVVPYLNHKHTSCLPQTHKAPLKRIHDTLRAYFLAFSRFSTFHRNVT